MAGAGIHIDLSGLHQLQRKLNELGGFDRRNLLDVIGATVESQTRRRIADEKTSPDGEQWPAWSADYAKLRHGANSLLQGQGDLLDSIGFVVGLNDVEIGSNLIYFATHQFGDDERNIPARTSLGLSPDNEIELQQNIGDWFEEILK